MNTPHQPYRVLFVCTANICRSPAAENIARTRFGESNAVFRSAGFIDTGQSCPAPMVQVLGDRHVDVTGHRSYMADAASLYSADLILTMEGAHVQKLTLLDRNAFSKTFPLKEAAQHMARLSGPTVSLENFLHVANQERDPRTYLSTKWDVADPYKRKLKDYKKAVVEISELLDIVLGRLVPVAAYR